MEISGHEVQISLERSLLLGPYPDFAKIPRKLSHLSSVLTGAYCVHVDGSAVFTGYVGTFRG